MTNDQKGALIEKIVFAVIPMLFSCTVYLISAINEINTKLNTLENKIAIVVTPENTPRPSASAELLREKLRQDFTQEQNESLIRHTENVGQIKLLTWRIEQLEKK